MRTTLLSCVLSGVFLASATGQGDPKSIPRVSLAEIEGVRLEVEQPAYKTEVRIRVRDFTARNHHKQTVPCAVYIVGDKGKESKIQALALRQTSQTSGNYSGSISDRPEFAHGNIIRVVYRGDGLPLPISTWYVFYYH